MSGPESSRPSRGPPHVPDGAPDAGADPGAPAGGDAPDTPRFPTAEVGPARRGPPLHRTRLWWVTLICILAAFGLFLSQEALEGPAIRVHFAEGHGLEEGNALRHRGIEVGRVAAVELEEDLSGVVVVIELEPRAAGVAREGSRFWIERPRLGLSEIRGIDTVVGAKYVRVEPGPPDAPRRTEFRGLETPLGLRDAGGPEIVVQLRDGHGLEAGDPLKHRGIRVGEVARVRLADGLDTVRVTLRLAETARRIAREGSVFWVERPVVDLTGVRGLETLLGGPYLAVRPGPPHAPPAHEFTGLERPPNAAGTADGLEVILETPDAAGLRPGVPVTYRGQEVGRVESVALASDASRVEVRAHVRAAFRDLVRHDTRWWMREGLDLQLGWSGLRLDTRSLITLAAGGVGFATPDEPGPPVSGGHRFPLHSEPEEDWLEWRPGIAVGSALLPEGAQLPRVFRATLVWEESTVGFRHEEERHGHVLRLNGGSLIGPADLLVPPDDALAGSARLRVDGRERELPQDTTGEMPGPGLARIRLPAGDAGGASPHERLRAPVEPEDVLVVPADPAGVTPVGAGSLRRSGPRWRVAPAAGLGPGAHGAAVVSRRDAKVVGVLLVEDEDAAVAPFTRP